MSQLTVADLRAQGTRGLFLFWRAGNERGFLFVHVLVDVRILLRICVRFFRWTVQSAQS